MRLVCPNCDAQYEVEDGAIAEAGRDVQCSNCGHAWFQMPPDLEAEIEAEDALFGAAPGTQMPQPMSARPATVPSATEASQDPVWGDEDFDDDDATAEDEDPAALTQTTEHPDRIEAKPAKAEPVTVATPSWSNAPDVAHPELLQAADQIPQPNPPRRGLDESLLAVLREEADRETAVRRSEIPRALESQSELGLEETTGATSAAKAVRDRLARLRGQEAEPETTEKPTARRDLLPDIEEINSTLRASTENRSGDELTFAQSNSAKAAANTGFRSGFSLMLLIAVLLIAAYLAAPKIAAQLPATKGALDSYVVVVDAARVWLDSAMRMAISGLQNLTGGDKI